MKKILPILTLLSVLACSKEDKIPTAVTDAFKAKYPNSIAKEWEKEDGAFEAKTMINDKEFEVAFDANGKWLETEREIKVDELPQSVRDSLAKSQYGAWKLKEAVRIESPEYAEAYELAVVNAKEKVSLYFTANGSLVKKENEEENEEEEGEEEDEKD